PFEDLHPQGSSLINPRACRLIRAETLTPTPERLFISDKNAPIAVISYAGAGFKLAARGDWQRRIHPDPRGIPHAAEIDVIISFFVGIPNHGHFAVLAGGDLRIPIICGRSGDSLFLAECSAALMQDQYVEVVAAVSLPCDPDCPGRIGDGHRVQVGARILGEANLVRPPAVSPIPRKEVVIPAGIRRPDYPDTAFPIHGDGGAIDVLPYSRNGVGTSPRLFRFRIFEEADLIAA